MEKSDRPQLPQGTSTTLGGLSETFSFHSSPESFITSRVISLQAQQPELFDSRAPVRAKILNRNIAVISSHAQISHILTANASHDADESTFVAAEAYQPLMGPFFPSPNVLLADGSRHREMRAPWEQRMMDIGPRIQSVTSKATQETLSSVDSAFDLYELLKRLVWKILLGLFLQLDENDPEFSEIERLQEDLLRGQFSLFPVSINVRWWQSPRSKGIAAKDKLQRLILKRVQRDSSVCPFRTSDGDREEVANHILLFTSSLAVKAIASLLMPFLLNLFLRRGDSMLAEELAQDETGRTALLRSILLETERLSPPIVGIMRQVTRDTGIPSSSDAPDVLIPKAWDAWLYFVGAGRDPAVFGPDCAVFDPSRFLHNATPHGFAFSVGPKKCLGHELVRAICIHTAQTMLDDGLELVGDEPPTGVKAWLGWEGSQDVDAAQWAKDMKQLPTQRPAIPILVRLVKR
jgi:cytochrome P450